MGADNKQEPIDAFTGPVDNYHANHIIVSVHSYDPYNFCNDAKQYNKNVFDESCASELDALFARVDKRFRQELGLPYFFGEFGAIDGNKKMEERVKYTGKIVELFKQYNTSGLWWMGLYDRKKGEWYEEEIVDALFQ
jgi:endoglucanase